jgi:hypothetical protein
VQHHARRYRERATGRAKPMSGSFTAQANRTFWNAIVVVDFEQACGHGQSPLGRVATRLQRDIPVNMTAWSPVRAPDLAVRGFDADGVTTANSRRSRARAIDP